MAKDEIKTTTKILEPCSLYINYCFEICALEIIEYYILIAYNLLVIYRLIDINKKLC